MTPPPPMVADHQVTEDTPVDLFEGSMDLLVVLPNDKCLPMSFDRRLPLMDLLIHIANTHKFSPGGHVLEVIDNQGSTLSCKPSTRLGTLNAHTVYVVAKNKINERLKSTLSAKSPRSTPPAAGSAQQQPFENTFRLQIRLPRNQLYVIRATWRTLLSEILQRVCADKGLDAHKYELRHPVHSDECLELSRTLADYQLQEVYVVPKGQNTYSTVSLSDVAAMKKASASRAKSPAASEAAANGNSADKKRRGLFGIVFGKKTKPGTGESIISSNSAADRSLSPSRSEEPPPAAVPTAAEPVTVSPSPPSPVLVSKKLAEEAVAKRNSRLLMLATTNNEALSPSQDKQSQQPAQQPKPPTRQKKKAAPPPPPPPPQPAAPSSNGTPKRPESVISSSSTSSDSTAVSSPASVVIRSAAASDIGSDFSSRPSSRRSIEPPLPARSPVGIKGSPVRPNYSTPKKAAAPMTRTSQTNLNQVKSTSELSLVSSAKKRKAPPPPPVPAAQPEGPKTAPAQKTSPPTPVAPPVAPKPSPRKKSTFKQPSSSNPIDSDDLELDDMDMFATRNELDTLWRKTEVSVISSDEELEECVVVHQSENLANRSGSSSDAEEIALNMLQVPRRQSRVSNSSRSEFFSISSRSTPENSDSDSDLEIQEMQLSFLLQRQKKKDAIPADLSMIPVEELQGLDGSRPADDKDFRRSISETTFMPEQNSLLLSTSPTRSQSYNISAAVDNNFAIFGSISSPFGDGRWNGDSTLTTDETQSTVIFDIKGWSSHAGGRDSNGSSTCSSSSSFKKGESESDPSYATVSFSSSKDTKAKPAMVVPSVEPVYAMVVKKNKPVQPDANQVKADDKKPAAAADFENKSAVQETSSSEDDFEPVKNVDELRQSSPVVPPEPLPRARIVSTSSSSSESDTEIAAEDLTVPDSPLAWNDEVPAPPPPMFQDDLESKNGVEDSVSESDSEAEIEIRVPDESQEESESSEAKLTLSLGTELEQETATDDLDSHQATALVLSQDMGRFGEESTTDDIVVCPPPDFESAEQPSSSSSSSESEPELLDKDSLNEDSDSDPDVAHEVKTASPSSVPETATISSPAQGGATPSVLALLSQAQNLLSSTADPNAKALQEEFIRLQQQFFAWQQLQQQPGQQPKKKAADSSSEEIDSSSCSESRKKTRRAKRKPKATTQDSSDEEEKLTEQRRQTLEEFKRKRREEKEKQEKLKEEEERKRKELEEWRRTKEEERKRKQREDEEKRRREEEQRAEEQRLQKEREEERRMKEGEERKRIQEERLRKEREEEERRMKEEEERKRIQEERLRKEREEEERRMKEEADRKRIEEERLRKDLEEKERKIKEAEEERLRTEEERRRKEKEEKRRRKEEEEEERKRIEEERLRKEREEEERRNKQEEERLRKEREEVERRMKEEEESQRLQRYLQQEEQERKEREEREKQKKREEAQDRMRQLLDHEELVLAQRERELLQQKRRAENQPSKRDSSSSSSSDSSDAETSTNAGNVAVKPAPVYRYRGPPQVTLEPWKPGRPKSEVIDLSSELTFDIPEPLLPHHKESNNMDTTPTSRDSPDSGIEGYDSLPVMPVTPPHKPEPPAKTFSLSRIPSVDTPRPYRPTAQQLFKRSTFVPVVNPVPFVQRKINKAPEVRGFSTVTTTETTESASLPTIGATSETKPRLLSIVQQEVSRQQTTQEDKLHVLRKVEIRQKAGLFERPQLRPVSMPVAPSGSGHLANIDTPTSSAVTETKRRISPAKFARASDPRDDLLKSIRDFSSGMGLKKTGVTLQ